MIVSLGTKIVILQAVRVAGGENHQPAGAVGVIIKAPADHTHAYRIRFPDASEANLRRTEFAVLKDYQREGMNAAPNASPLDAIGEFELSDCIIFRCVIGSRAYGLSHDDSDTDRRGIYLPSAEQQWSLYGVPEQLENAETQECYWELQKFLVLALKANPNVLECLYTPLIELASPLAQELLSIRAAFLSKMIYQTYNGYVLSQFKKLTADLRNRGEIRWKHAMHLIRLLLAGITALREGYVPVNVETHRERLLAIRDGATPWEEIEEWRLGLHREFDAAFEATKLPERPDCERANALLIRARREKVDES